MAEKLIYIRNDDLQSYLYCRLQLVVETFGRSKYEPTNQNEQYIPPYCEGVILCNGDVNQFIGHRLIPSDPWYLPKKSASLTPYVSQCGIKIFSAQTCQPLNT